MCHNQCFFAGDTWVSASGIVSAGSFFPLALLHVPRHLESGVGYMSCRGTWLIRPPPLLGPYSRTIPRVLWWS